MHVIIKFRIKTDTQNLKHKKNKWAKDCRLEKCGIKPWKVYIQFLIFIVAKLYAVEQAEHEEEEEYEWKNILFDVHLAEIDLNVKA